jgi:hypothetical protein
VIKKSKFYNNNAGQNTINIMYTKKIVINETTFIKNSATQLSKNIFAGFSELAINDCFFEDEIMSKSLVKT